MAAFTESDKSIKLKWANLRRKESGSDLEAEECFEAERE